MPDNPSSPAPALGMNFGDILYVVFRHKWKIAFMSAAGLVVACCLPFVIPRIYQSEAKLYVRYVLETESPSQSGPNDSSRIRLPETRGDTIMNTEVEILNNLSLARQVAQAIGPEKILGKGATAADVDKAAVVILKSLTLDVPKNTSVLHLIFKHSNPEIVQAVLQQLIEFYRATHIEIHKVGALDEALTRETDDRRSRLEKTKEELRKAKAKIGVGSIEDAKKALSEQMARINQQVSDSEAELAEHQATINELTRLLQNGTIGATNLSSTTNDLAVTPEKLAEYRRVSGLVETLERKEQELSLTFTRSNSLVTNVQMQIDQNQRLKKQLETQNPGLLSMRVTGTNALAAGGGAGQQPDPTIERARVSALQARIKTLTNTLASIRERSAVLNEAEGRITELQTRQELEEAQYKHFSQKLDQSKTEERLGAGRVFNISTIQAPSPPLRPVSELRKTMLMVFFGSIASAIGIAFLIELLLDRSVKRPIDIESKLGLRLFMSVPLSNGNGKSRRLADGKPTLLLPQGGSDGETPPGHQSLNTELAPWDAHHALRPFHDALRDRLINYFEVKNLTHKPKLVAVTGCAEGSGVSTIAAGLAASLSETGDGSVLLVDMNVEQGAAHHFYKGDLACGLDEALEADKRDSALVQHNLYVVTESSSGDKLPSVLPKRFKNLVPRLKASDYDYIIFDMPPVSQISLTPRLARFMDMVLMVVESEKTDSEVVKRACFLLEESKANVGVVLNKARTYVPKRLQQEL